MNVAAWKFLRMRPANFPTLRIAQFAALIHQSSHLFSKILETEELSDLFALFEVDINSYWHTHYVFDKISEPRPKKLGTKTIELILINTVVPFLFLYGTIRNEQAVCTALPQRARFRR